MSSCTPVGCQKLGPVLQRRRFAGGTEFTHPTGSIGQSRVSVWGAEMRSRCKSARSQCVSEFLRPTGFARVLVVGRPFQRVTAYRAAEARAQSSAVGKWSACGTEPAPPPPPLVAPPPAPPPVAPTPPPRPSEPRLQPCRRRDRNAIRRTRTSAFRRRRRPISTAATSRKSGSACGGTCPTPTRTGSTATGTRHGILSLGACRLYDEPTRICKPCAALRRERASLPRSGVREPG